MTAPPISERQPRGADQFRTVEQFRDRPVLFQVETAATTATTLYTVPKGRMATVKVYVAENGGSAATVRLALRKGGEATADKAYIAYTYALAANDRDEFGPFDLAADDIVEVYASTATVSWTANGTDRPRDTT